MGKILKQEKAITLIALVITIIILLILAGISIASLTGNNSLTAKANISKEEMKKAEYKESLMLIGNGLQPDRIINQWDNQEYMDQYEEKIRLENTFKEAQEIKQLPNANEITIQVTVKEGWIYLVTEKEIKLVENIEEEIPPELEVKEIYVALKGNTLVFGNDEEEIRNESDKFYGEISDATYTRSWSTGPNTPWYVDREKIQSINFETKIWPANMACYFSDLEKVTQINNIGNLRTENATSMYALFYNCTSLTNIDIVSFKTENVETMDAMFYKCSSLATIKGLDKIDTSKVTNMNSMFSYCSSLTSIDISNFNMDQVEQTAYMFQSSSNLQTIKFPEKMNTVNLTTIREMFTNCEKLIELDLSNLNRENVTEMRNVFSNCKSLKNINISNWNTGKVKDMRSLFTDCESLININISDWNVQNVTTLDSLFRNCTSLTSIDISNWNTEKVVSMGGAFLNCTNITSINLANWNTKNVDYFAGMFNYCTSLREVNCKEFTIKDTADISDMFAECQSISDMNISKMDLTNHTGNETWAFASIPDNVKITTNKNMKEWLETKCTYANFNNIITID